MKQKVITFTKEIQFDADIKLELNENELTKMNYSLVVYDYLSMVKM